MRSAGSSVAPIRLAVVGMGKIARDQHFPAIAADDGFQLAATVDPKEPGLSGVPHFGDLGALLADGTAFDAVVLCTPPQVRHALATLALTRGLHVFLEKPPGITLSEVEILREQAAALGVTLLAGWHSRFAPCVEPARLWLASRRIARVSVVWREDVRVWHPGQTWIWEAGGFGVFDPGINALSILSYILPNPFYVAQATLAFPANCAAPIAALVRFRDTAGAQIEADFDFRQTGPQSWDVVVETDAGPLTLSEGGAVLSLPSGTSRMSKREYPCLYRHFGDLIRTGRSDVDVSPLRLVADAFLRGRRESVEAFYD
jgi:D-galactose 1-dehydrogenase